MIKSKKKESNGEKGKLREKNFNRVKRNSKGT